MNTSLVYLRPVQVAYVRVRGPYAVSSAQAWEKMLAWLDAHMIRNVVERGFGLAHDDPRCVDQRALRYDACVQIPVDTMPDAFREFSVQTLPGGAFARRRYVGPHSGIRDEFHNMRSTWAPARGLALDNKRPFVEIYLDDPLRCPPNELRTDLCIPVMIASNASAA